MMLEEGQIDLVWLHILDFSGSYRRLIEKQGILFDYEYLCRYENMNVEISAVSCCLPATGEVE